ncbi:MAG: M3 family metallopeptidase [Bacteroidia bacterium]|jgi:peptidyl-dipeptidase Dcp|nr:M3 family metallopeptidase [Bacteroidia bacterium]
MLRNLVIALTIVAFATACKTNQKEARMNPFMQPYDAPFGIPPFEKITLADYMPAFEAGMAEQKAEVEAISSNPDAPTFANTVEALERSGALLTRVSDVFFNLNSSLTSDSMQALAKAVSPKLSAHNDDIMLNQKLFERVKALHDQMETLELNQEQKMLLDKLYKRFVRGGALLNDEQKDQLRKINEELSLLSLQFGDNVLAENNKFKVFIENKDDLAGLPETFLNNAAEAAAAEGKQGQWLLTLHKPSLIPVLQFAHNRALREKMYKGYIMRGDNNDELDNKKLVLRTADLRLQKAKLLGYPNHAAFVLDQTMAKTPDAVLNFVADLSRDAMPMARKEAEELQKMINKTGGNFKLEPWDWWYYAEMVRKEKYDLDENALRPYFKLENVRDGVFALAGKLYGLKFNPRNDLPKYHPDVEVYEVTESDGSHVGILYMDYFPRPSKSGGAWMSNFREQSIRDGQFIHPIVTTNYNFTAPSAGMPALLSWDEVETLFHEMGHALHGLLANTTYTSLSGTNVPRDFVELPSQIMENWASEPEMLALYAFHYQTGELIPNELVEKMQRSGKFNQGFAMAEYLAASQLDMDWHVLESDIPQDVDAFEAVSVKKSGLIPEIVPRYRSTYFSHIFSGGYSAGYYSYLWAEVLDADAFEAFKENGLFDQTTAGKFRTFVLEKGGTVDPMELYVAFRGKQPDRKALLKKRGII